MMLLQNWGHPWCLSYLIVQEGGKKQTLEGGLWMLPERSATRNFRSGLV